jgi:Protein of unknown function (DUF2442)
VPACARLWWAQPWLVTTCSRPLFSNGMVGDIAFSAERWTGARAPLNDSAYFAEVAVNPEAGTVVWPDGIELAPELLYEQAKAHPLVATA